jgi:hypothetical protein
MNLIFLIPAMSAPAFILAATALLRRFKRIPFPFASEQRAPVFYCLELPSMIAVTVLVSMTATFPRHVEIYIPYLCVLAGFQADRIIHFLEKWRPHYGHVFVGLILLYPFVSSVWMEFEHVRGRGHEAFSWTQAHASADHPVWLPGATARRVIANVIPAEDVTPDVAKAAYFEFNEEMILSVRRSYLTPLRAWPDAKREVRKFVESPAFLQSILKGDGDFRLAAYFPQREIVPEFLLFKKIFGSFNTMNGDIWIYERAQDAQ